MLVNFSQIYDLITMNDRVVKTKLVRGMSSLKDLVGSTLFPSVPKYQTPMIT